MTYTYDGAHRVKTRIDAKGQKTQYTYDQFGRKSIVQHYNASGVEQTNQRITYIYGDNYNAPTDFSQNSWGRLAQVTFGNETSSGSTNPTFQYLYSYTQSGHVTTNRMGLGTYNVNLDATYQWDNEGKMTSMLPPGTGANKYYYFYDALGRLSSMTEATCPGGVCNPTGTTVGTASYGAAGEITALTYDSFSETRTYNTLLQLTRMTATSGGTTVMDMLYTFSPTQNNGRITQSTDNVSGETVVYTYDTLNRLVHAAANGGAWSEASTYDGFGNLTAKTPTGTAPAMTASYDLSNHQVGQSYDANGNTGLSGTFPYDVENHLLQPLVSGTGVQWSYDPSGKRVFAQSSTMCEFYFYGRLGERLLTYDCVANQVKSRNLYFAGKLMRSTGVAVVTDRLGSVRANSNGERMNYFPYGEERTATADGREKFGTYFRDSAANGGLDYADQRYYSNSSGRFMTADPYAASASSPQDSGTPVSCGIDVWQSE